MFAQLWASLKIFFCRLPSFGQVLNSFFDVCPALGKSQILFYRLPKRRQVANSFFEVCRVFGKPFKIFLRPFRRNGM